MPEGIIDPPGGFGHPRPDLRTIEEMIESTAPAEPGIRVTVDFIHDRKRYGAILPAVPALPENEDALVDAISGIVASAVRLHFQTSKGV